MNAPLDPRPARLLNETTRLATQTTTLSPRFYTTDFDQMNASSVEPVRAEWDELMAELKADRNLHHFKRDERWKVELEKLPEALKKEFLDFLVSSLTAEFSGCVLYAEIRKRGSNPDLCALFKYMSRDEARHAGFINDALKDFGVDVDLGFLVKAKQYTYFSPKFILMATYLSEKIGYARYITIFRHLEAHPEFRFHPIFLWFKEWCNDEFRHGEALALLLKANGLTNGVNRYWARFFQLSVFATMYVRDHHRPEFHQALGLEPEAYGLEVFRKTVEISKQIFPVLLDLEHPAFLAGLRRLNALANEIEAAKRQGGVLGLGKRLFAQARTVATFVSMYFIKPKENAPPSTVRLQPAY